ncbi:MAG: BrnT family toxin [Rivularia sp. (in: cyanobacteria)]
MRYNFDWNPQKEKQNIRKHNLSFRQAASIFNDPNQLSIYDEEHSDNEDRWITIGLDSAGILRIVIHTFEQIDESSCEIRIISARKATSNEAKQYQ